MEIARIGLTSPETCSNLSHGIHQAGVAYAAKKGNHMPSRRNLIVLDVIHSLPKTNSARPRPIEPPYNRYNSDLQCHNAESANKDCIDEKSENDGEEKIEGEEKKESK